MHACTTAQQTMPPKKRQCINQQVDGSMVGNSAAAAPKKRKWYPKPKPNPIRKIKYRKKSPYVNNRNWLEIPSDVVLNIFKRLSNLQVLERAQFVCKPWYDLCKEPSLWRTIAFRNNGDAEDVILHKRMILSGVDRSAGGLLEFDIEGFGSDRSLTAVVSRASQLKRLRVAYCDNISDKAFIEAFEKLPHLEEVDLTLCELIMWDEIAGNWDEKAVISACPPLKTLKFNKKNSTDPADASDEVALTIAARMPELRHLQLIGNNMTTIGLTAILDGCPHLQSLDLRACYQLDLKGDLEKRVFEQIKDVKRVWDSTKEFKRDFRIYHYSEDCWDECDPTFSDDDNPDYTSLYIDYYSL